MPVLIGYNSNNEEEFRGNVEITDYYEIVAFDEVFTKVPLPHHMKVEKDGKYYPCMSWCDYELGTNLTGVGANSNDFLDWDEYNEWLVSVLAEFCDCEPYPYLYANNIEPFIR